MTKIDISEIGTTKIDTTEIGMTKIGITEVRHDWVIIHPPLVPLCYSLFENMEMFRVCHSPSPLLRELNALPRLCASFQRAMVSFTALHSAERKRYCSRLYWE